MLYKDIVMLIYLGIQSIADIKVKTVNIAFNILMILVMGIWYIISPGLNWETPYMLLCLIGIVLCEKFRLFGSGDTKALIALLFTYNGNLLLFLMMILVTNLVFCIYGFIYTNIQKNKGTINKVKEARPPYFPAMFVGHLIISTIGMKYGIH